MTNTALALALILIPLQERTPHWGDWDRHGVARAVGPYQIHAGVVEDCNRFLGRRYDWIRCMNQDYAREVCRDYLLLWCGPGASLERYVRTWNGGPRGPRKPATLAYWRGIRRLGERVARAR